MSKYPKIAGVEKLSLSDYPGEVATVLFVSGCNMNCPYCHNKQLATAETKKTSSFNEELLDNPLKDAVVITGGEPTLHGRALYNLSKLLKGKGYKVKIDTNGADTNILKEMIEDGLVDYVAMDIKQPVSEYGEKYGDYKKEKVLNAMEVVRKAPRYEFRTTCDPYEITEKDIEKIHDVLNSKDTYFLQPKINTESDMVETNKKVLDRLASTRENTFVRD